MPVIKIKENLVLYRAIQQIKKCDIEATELSVMVQRNGFKREEAWQDIFSQLPKEVNRASIKANSEEISFELKPAIIT